jgi:predicted nucleic acid-binding protein
MNNLPVNAVVLAVALIAVAVVLVAWFAIQKQRTSRLKQRFGSEYGHAVSEFGSRSKAEAELRKREVRVERLNIAPLTAADATRFAQAWSALQGRFIDNPKGVVVEADLLVRELMVKRGYPMSDFERRAADISVDHPDVVTTYRTAQAIAQRDQRGEADTEELRKAVVHYRTLFDELLEVKSTPSTDLAPARIPVHS